MRSIWQATSKKVKKVWVLITLRPKPVRHVVWVKVLKNKKQTNHNLRDEHRKFYFTSAIFLKRSPREEKDPCRAEIGRCNKILFNRLLANTAIIDSTRTRRTKKNLREPQGQWNIKHCFPNSHVRNLQMKTKHKKWSRSKE